MGKKKGKKKLLRVIRLPVPVVFQENKELLIAESLLVV